MKVYNFTDTLAGAQRLDPQLQCFNLPQRRLDGLHSSLRSMVDLCARYYHDRTPELIDLWNKMEVSFFNNSSVVAGWATVNAAGMRKLELNIYYMHDQNCSQHMLEQTLPHELAHLVCYHLFGKLDHGPAWKYVMYQILKVPPERLHSMGRLTPARLERIKADVLTQALSEL